MKEKLIILILLFIVAFTQAQQININHAEDSTMLTTSSIGKPKPFSFLTHVPDDLLQIAKSPFQKRNLRDFAIIAGISAALILEDTHIYKGVRNFSDHIQLPSAEKNRAIWQRKIFGKETVLLKAPQNINTAFYNLGQGFTTLIVAAGFYAGGKISHNNRSLQTASDLSESFIALGIVTEILKYATGREVPSVASKKRAGWHPFPSLSSFQNNKPHYDAFPSGHLSTLMAAVTILANNYPASRLIKPIGYTLVALTGFAMINNGVHWAGDYPLAIGLGYLTGNIITSRHAPVWKKINLSF